MNAGNDMDPLMAAKIREMVQAKDEAVEVEDFHTANILKKAIQSFKRHIFSSFLLRTK